MSTDPVSQSLQGMVNSIYEEQAVIVTGWVAYANVLEGDQQRVIQLTPKGQAPALSAGISRYGEQISAATVEGNLFDEGEED